MNAREVLEKNAQLKDNPVGKAVGLGLKGVRIYGKYQEGKAQGAKAATEVQQATKTVPPPDGVKGVHASKRYRLKKEAGREFTDMAQHVGRSALISAGGALGGMGAQLMAKGVGGMFERSRRNRLWQQLVQRNRVLAKDQRARDYFDLAMTYAPSLGKHPIAIGDFLKKQLQYPVSSHEFLKSLADFEATVTKTEGERVPARIGLAFEAPFGQYAGKRLGDG